MNNMELDKDVLYEMIFKRKSFHLFKNTGNQTITKNELELIQKTYTNLSPLYANIKTKMKIVAGDMTTCQRGQEYCLLFYSEKKNNYGIVKITYCLTDSNYCINFDGDGGYY